MVGEVKGKFTYSQSKDSSVENHKTDINVNIVGKDGKCFHMIEDSGADGTINRYSTMPYFKGGGDIKDCPRNAKPSGLFLSRSMKRLTDKMESVITDAISKGKFKRADIVKYSLYFPRGVGKNEWALRGKNKGISFIIIGNKDGILHIVMDEHGKTMFDNDAFGVRIFDSTARDNPFLKTSLNKIFEKIKSHGLNKQSSLAKGEKTRYPIKKIKSFDELQKSLIKLTTTVEEGATYFERNGVKRAVRWKSGEESTIMYDASTVIDPNIVKSDKIVDVHVHPFDGGIRSETPSTMDMSAVITVSYLLDRHGFEGEYKHFVITKSGTYSIEPNLKLLRSEPDKFYRYARLAMDVDGIRGAEERIKSFLHITNSTPALKVKFTPVDDF